MEKKEILKTVKQVVTIGVSVGVTAIVTCACKHVAPPDMNLIKKICFGVGTITLGSLVSDAAADHAEKKIDDTAEKVKEFLTDSEEVPAESEAVTA